MPRPGIPQPLCPRCGAPLSEVYGYKRRRPWLYCLSCQPYSERVHRLLGLGPERPPAD